MKILFITKGRAMRFLVFLPLFFLSFTFSAFAQAPELEGVQSFSAPKNAIEQEPILPEVPAFMGDVAVKNIVDAEQVFCYTVEKRAENYQGYTLDGFAVTGFCGIINKNLHNRIVKEFFRTPNNVLLNDVEDCQIAPRAIIRFVRGVDTTDVLISNPCYSYAIFYGNKLKAFNVKPMSNFISALTKAFDSKRINFESPALHGQLAPIGRAPAGEENVAPDIEESPVVEDFPKPKGWNNLSF